MNPLIRSLMVVLFAATMPGLVKAATLAEYTFQRHSLTPSAVDVAVSASKASLTGGWATGNNGGIYLQSSANIPLHAISQNQCASFVIATSGSSLNLETLYFDLGGWSNYVSTELKITIEVYAQLKGAKAFSVGKDSLTVPATSGRQVQQKSVSLVLSTFKDLQKVQGSVEFLIYAYTDADAGSASNRYMLNLNNLGLTGEVTVAAQRERKGREGSDQ